MAMAQRCMPATKDTTKPVELAKPKLPHYARSKYQPHVGKKQGSKMPHLEDFI